MRGVASGQTSMLLVWNPIERIPAAHPIRRIKALADGALEDLSGVFDRMYSYGGRPSIPPDDDPGNPTVNFRGEQRRNDTHASTTDPEARLAKKSTGTEAKLAFCAHVLMENRHGLCVDIAITPPSGRAEPEQALAMVKRQQRRGVRIKTLGADSYYDNEATIAALRRRGVTPHVAKHPKRRNLDKRTTRHEGYVKSQRCRKKIEEIFGWMKTVGGFRRTRYRGTELWAHIVGSAYNLVRIAKLEPATA